MVLDNVRKKILPATLVAISVFTVSGLSGATVPDTGPNVTFTASGTFSTPQVSGNDTLKLAGEPFIINVVAVAGSTPVKHGRNWAVFSPLKMTGVVHSGLLGPQPVNIVSKGANILQMVSATEDPVKTSFPVKVVGISLTIQAQFILPAGTLAKPLIQTFAGVALSPANTTVTYSNGTDSTTLTIASGTLVATASSGGSAQTAEMSPAVELPHAVGFVSEGPVALAAASRQVALKRRRPYASG